MGLPRPPKIGSNFGQFSNASEKYRGWSGKVFPLREYLAPRSVAGDLHPFPPFFPRNFLRGVEVPNFDPQFTKNWSSDFHQTLPVGGGSGHLVSLKISLQKKHFCTNCGHFCIRRNSPKVRFRPKDVRSSELSSRDRVHIIDVCCRGELRNLCPPPPMEPAVPHIILHFENFALKTFVFDRK